MHQILDISLLATPAAPTAAREAIDDLAELRGLPQLAFDVRMLVSELVTNSVRHAGLTNTQPIRLLLQLSPGTLRCEIHDPGPGFRPPQDPRPRSEGGGWGLYLVARLTQRWGIESTNGTTVWFEVDLPQPPQDLPKAD
jgi:anti-sigma regulatory factor (Ser/Thr protein kinase)